MSSAKEKQSAPSGPTGGTSPNMTAVATPVMDDVIRAGYLYKDQKRRWVELRSGSMTFYRDRGADARRIVRLALNQQNAGVRDFPGGQRPFGFYVYSGTAPGAAAAAAAKAGAGAGTGVTSLTLYAESAEQKIEWMRAIQDTINTLNDPTYTGRRVARSTSSASIVAAVAAAAAASEEAFGEGSEDGSLASEWDTAFDQLEAEREQKEKEKEKDKEKRTPRESAAIAAATSSVVAARESETVGMAEAATAVSEAVSAAVAGRFAADECRLLMPAQIDVAFRDTGRVVYVDVLVAVTRFRVIVLRGARKPCPSASAHLWDVETITVDLVRNCVHLALRGGQAPIYFFAAGPVLLVETIRASLTAILPRHRWPPLRGLGATAASTSWDWEEELPDQPASASKAAQKVQPAKPLNPVDLYLAQCVQAGKPASSTFVHYLEHLVRDGVTELDLTRFFTQEDDTAQTIGFLAHDTFFRGVVLANIARRDALPAAAAAMRANTHLTRIGLRGVGADEKQVAEFADALRQSASHHTLCSLDLSSNNVRDSGVKVLAVALEKLPHGLAYLNLSNAGIGPKGFQILVEAFRRNLGMSLALEHLDISRNKLEDAGTHALENWIAEASLAQSHLRVLSLGFSRASVNLLASLGRLQPLSDLDISGTRIDEPSAIVLTGAVRTLAHLSIASCQFSKNSMLLGVLRAFLSNARPLSLDLSAVEVKHSGGSSSSGGASGTSAAPRFAGLQRLLSSSSLGNVTRLSLSGLGINHVNFVGLASVLAVSGKIERLELDSPAADLVQGHETHWAGAFSHLVAECRSLASLSIADGYGVRVIVPLLETLSTNSTLLALNVAGNQLGDTGAVAVAEMIRQNKHLVSVIFDRNGTTFVGLQAVNAALAVNSTILSLGIREDTLREIGSAATGGRSPEVAGKLWGLMAGAASRLAANFARAPRPIPETLLPYLPPRLCDTELACWITTAPRDMAITASPKSPPPLLASPQLANRPSFHFASLFSSSNPSAYSADDAAVPMTSTSPSLAPTESLATKQK